MASTGTPPPPQPSIPVHKLKVIVLGYVLDQVVLQTASGAKFSIPTSDFQNSLCTCADNPPKS